MDFPPLPPTAAEAVRPDRSETADGKGFEGLANGSYALQLIQRQTRRLGKLQPAVLEGGDPEALHQLRVSLRRLRTALDLFAPALELPEGVSEARLAGVERRTGLSRDLDVLAHRFETSLLPALPALERERLAPALKRLARDRKAAYGDLVETLSGGRYLKLLARLGLWQRRPAYTALGQLPLLEWLPDWQAPVASDLFLQPGWRAQDPRAESLHGLRKRIKVVRYALEHLEPFLDPTLLAWLAELRQAQDDLGELHDLQVLERSLGDRALRLDGQALPELLALIRRQQAISWDAWQRRAPVLCSDASRRSLRQHLQGVPPAQPGDAPPAQPGDAPPAAAPPIAAPAAAESLPMPSRP
jgi:CHAD domain-containing protein